MEEEYTKCITTSPEAPPEDVQIQRGMRYIQDKTNVIADALSRVCCMESPDEGPGIPLLEVDAITHNLHRTLKILQIYFLAGNRKKTFRRIFSYNFGCRKKNFERFSCLKFIFKKSKPESRFTSD